MTAAKTPPTFDPSTTTAATGAPPPADAPVEVKPGPDQVVVTSPTGTRTVVSKAAADNLKAQGYSVG